MIKREMKSKSRLLPEALSLETLSGITRILKEYLELRRYTTKSMKGRR
jgi:hypothetical protein